MSVRTARFSWSVLGLAAAVALGSLVWSGGQDSLAAQVAEAEAAAKEKVEIGTAETLLPKTPVFALDFKGSKHSGAAFEQTAAYEAFYKSGLVDIVTRILTSLGEQGGGQEFALFRRVFETVNGEGFSAAAWMTGGEGGPPNPNLIIVLKNAGELEPQIGGFIKQASGIEWETRETKVGTVTWTLIPDSPGVEFGWWIAGDHLAVVAGIDTINAAVDIAAGNAASLDENKEWAALQKVEDGTVASSGWFNFAPLREQFGEMPIPLEGRGGQPVFVIDLLQSLGLDSLQRVETVTSYQGKATYNRLRVVAPGPRRGLLAGLTQDVMTIDDLPPIPGNTLGFAAWNADYSAIYESLIDTAERTAALGPEEVSRDVEGFIDGIPQMLGFDPKKQLLDALGDTTAVYSEPSQGIFGFGFGACVKVENEGKLLGTLAFLQGLAAAETDRDEFEVVSNDKHGTEIKTLRIGGGFFNPSYCVQDGWFVVGLVPQVCESFVLRSKGDLPKWTPDAEVQAALQELPNEFSSITVADTRGTYRMLMGAAPFVAGFIEGTARQELDGELEIPFQVADLPPTEVVTRPLFPTVGVSVPSEDGVTTITRASAPAIPLLGDSQMVVAAPVLVGLLLPAVQQAREAARRSASKNNLKQIGLAMHNYHDTYGHMPTGTYVDPRLKPGQEPKLKPEQRLSFYAALLPYMEQAPLYEELDLDEAWDSDTNSDAAFEEIPSLINPGVWDSPAVMLFEEEAVEFEIDEPKPAVVEEAEEVEVPQLEAEEGVEDEAEEDTSWAARTHYVGISGVGADAATLPRNHKRAGMFSYNTPTRFRDVTDGLSNTMMTSEVSGSSAPPWLQGKVTLRSLTKKPYIYGPDGFGGVWNGGFQIGLGDGAVRFVSDQIDEDVLKGLFTISGGEVLNEF